MGYIDKEKEKLWRDSIWNVISVFVMARFTQSNTVRNFKSQVRKLGEWFNMVGVQKNTSFRTKPASIIIALKDRLAPFFVYRVLPDTFIDRRYTSIVPRPLSPFAFGYFLFTFFRMVFAFHANNLSFFRVFNTLEAMFGRKLSASQCSFDFWNYFFHKLLFTLRRIWFMRIIPLANILGIRAQPMSIPATLLGAIKTIIACHGKFIPTIKARFIIHSIGV